MEIASRSARTPFACSILMRLFRAICRPFVAACDALIVRSWITPTVAMSESARTSLASPSESRPGASRSRFNAADHLITQPQRHAVNSSEADLQRTRRERRPTSGFRDEIGRGYHEASAERIEAWPVVVLQLEQLQHPAALGGGGDRLEATRGRGEHHGGLVDLDEIDARRGEEVEEVDDVVVVDEGVGEVDEGVDQRCFPTRPGEQSLADQPSSTHDSMRIRRFTTSSATSATRRPVTKAISPESEQRFIGVDRQPLRDHAGSLVDDRRVSPRLDRLGEQCDAVDVRRAVDVVDSERSEVGQEQRILTLLENAVVPCARSRRQVRRTQPHRRSRGRRTPRRRREPTRLRRNPATARGPGTRPGQAPSTGATRS